MNNTVENDFSWISQGKVATSELDKSARFSRQIFLGFNVGLTNIIKIG